MVNATPRAALPQEKTRYPLYRVRVGPRIGLDGCGKLRPYRVSTPGAVQPVASSCTYCTLPAQNRTKLPKGNLSLIMKGTANVRTVKDLEIQRSVAPVFLFVETLQTWCG